MCKAYTLTVDSAQLAAAFDADPPANWQPHYNVWPGELMPVITMQAPGGFGFFYWGATPGWLKNRSVSSKIINTPAERVITRPVYKRALARHRCLVPADGFYAWKTFARKRQIPYRYTLADGSVFAFAGLWEEFDTLEDEIVHTFSIITTPANELLAAAGSDMPVILTGRQQQLWLDPASSEQVLEQLLTSLPAKAMHGYPVSPEIQRAGANHPGLIKHVPPADQHGHYMLFE